MSDIGNIVEEIVGHIDFNADTKLDEIMDDFDRIELAGDIETTYSIEVLAKEIQAWQTIKDVVNFVEGKLK